MDGLSGLVMAENWARSAAMHSAFVQIEGRWYDDRWEADYRRMYACRCLWAYWIHAKRA